MLNVIAKLLVYCLIGFPLSIISVFKPLLFAFFDLILKVTSRLGGALNYRLRSYPMYLIRVMPAKGESETAKIAADE
jgi:hypothetical protein